MASELSIALVGPGAIGTTIAAALHEKGRTPILCGRTPHAELRLRYEGGQVVIPGPVLTEPKEISHPIDLVFVAVKTTQDHAAAAWLKTLCNEDTIVCALQNGVEQVAQLAPYVKGASIIPSVVWFPAQRERDNSVWLRDNPRLTLPDYRQSQTIISALKDSRCHVEVTADFNSVAWRKLIQNAVAGLMVLSNRRAGMFSREDIRALALNYAQECLNVARAEGAQLSDSVPEEVVNRFSQAPSDLGTSILADRQSELPLEWEIRNGIIQRCGRAHKIDTPISDVIVPLMAAASDGPG